MIVDEFTELPRRQPHAAGDEHRAALVHHRRPVPAARGAPARLERIAGADGVWLTTPREIHQAVLRFARQLFPPHGAWSR